MPQHHRQTTRIRQSLQSFATQINEPLRDVLTDITSNKPFYPGGAATIEFFLNRYPLNKRDGMRPVVMQVAHEYRLEVLKSQTANTIA
jgi:hypothetical protein